MDALTLLRNAGWREGRRIKVADDLETLRAEDFPVTDIAERFLSEYSGLSIAPEGGRRPLVINAGLAARHVFPGWAEAYSKAVGSVFVPVGEYSHMTLYIDLGGGLWGGYDREFGKGGSSLLEVIQGMYIDEPGWRFDRLLELD